MAARPAVLALLAAASLGATGCVVLKKDYDKCRRRRRAGQGAGRRRPQGGPGARSPTCRQQLAQLRGGSCRTATRASTTSTTTSHNVQAQLDEATAINQQLRGELERLGKDADKLLAERGTLSKALDDAKDRLDELRKAQAAAEARTQLFHDLAHRFKPLIDAGQLRIETAAASSWWT